MDPRTEYIDIPADPDLFLDINFLWLRMWDLKEERFKIITLLPPLHVIRWIIPRT